jgi:hypothetical protein
VQFKSVLELQKNFDLMTMAKMIPNQLPPDPRRSPAEKKVYQKFQEVLDNRFTVFYSRPWLRINQSGEETDGECDFVVAHPDYGFIAIEVKGGGIAYDSKTDIWTSRNREGKIHNLKKDPIKQAVASKYMILEEYRKHKRWDGRRIRIRHGIIFPDSKKPSKDLGVDKPRYLFCFLEEFENNLSSWILKRFTEHSSDDYRVKTLGESGIQILDDILAKSFQLDQSLAHNLIEDDIYIDALTEDQCRYLRGIVHVNKKIAISGAAGTGKTILAMQEARESIKAGERVLFTCYNRPLSLFIDRKLGNHKLLTIATYPSFCESVLSEANIAFEDTSSLDDRFYIQCPKYLPEALKLLPEKRFDTIIIDEGQDFRLPMLKSLEFALDPSGKGKMRLFYDNNQDVYHNLSDDIVKLFEIQYPLMVNLRNTKKIYAIAQRFYKGNETEAAGPDGVEVRWIEAGDDESIKSELNKNIKCLVEKEQIHPSNIAVLIPRSADVNKFGSNGRLGGFQFQSANESDKHITFDSVRRFKGLEKSVVVIIVNDELLKNEEMLYVALSRPRTLLALIGSKKVFEKISSKNT